MSTNDIPGVHAVELPSPPGPLVGVSTSSGAFLMVSERGEPNAYTKVQSWEEFKLKMGSAVSGEFGAYAAKGFFDNGGRTLYCVRVMKAGTDAVKATLALKEDDNIVDVMRVTAKVAGVSGNSITVKVEAGTVSGYKITIDDSITPEVYDNQADVASAAVAINAASLLVDVVHLAGITFKLIAATPLAGGAPVGTGYAYSTVTLNDRAGAPLPTLTIKAITPGAWGNGAADGLTLDVADATLDPINKFKLTVKLDGSIVEVWDELSMDSTNERYAVSVLNTGSNYISAVDEGSVTVAPNDRPAVQTATALASGSDGASVTDSDFISAFSALTPIEENINIAAPGHPGSSQAINIAGIAYARASNKHTYFCDLASDLTVNQVQSARTTLGYDSYGAVYYPWILVQDPFGVGSNPVKFVPPSGHVIGVTARIDLTRGTHKAAAGTEANIVGALGVQTKMGDTEQEQLNPLGVNIIRVFNNIGIVIWGNRTLSNDPKLLFLQTRRHLNYLKSSFKQDFQTAVFEPNDSTLWAQLIRRGKAFLKNEWDKRAIRGKTLDEACFIKCDSELNTPALIDQGRLIYRVGVVESRPAEVITLEFTQWDGGAQITEA